jgi:hypothetical protein
MAVRKASFPRGDGLSVLADTKGDSEASAATADVERARGIEVHMHTQEEETFDRKPMNDF